MIEEADASRAADKISEKKKRPGTGEVAKVEISLKDSLVVSEEHSLNRMPPSVSEGTELRAVDETQEQDEAEDYSFSGTPKDKTELAKAAGYSPRRAES